MNPASRTSFPRWLSSLFVLCLLVPGFLCASEAYFSPDGGIRDQIIKRVNRSQKSIDIAMYSFTDGPIAQALADARRRGVAIRLIRDVSQSHGKNDENAFLQSEGIVIKQMSGKGRGIFHNKFAIFDNQLLETGSFNWTVNAEKYNHENAIFFTDPELVAAFRKEFEKLWKDTTPIPKPKPRRRRPTNPEDF